MTAPVGARRGFPVIWEGVHFGYDGGDVIHDVSLSVEAGRSVAVVGPNGAGKTTLTRMLVALVRPRAGRVLVGDWDVASRRPHEMARRVGYAFQHVDQQLFARTVREDVSFGPRRLRLGTAHVEPLLAELELDDVAGVHPYDLPMPLRKVVALAGVLAMQPGVLVLDEPTAGFGRELRALVVAALERRRAAGLTLIVVTHDVHLVASLAHREVVLESGSIIADRRLS